MGLLVKGYQSVLGGAGHVAVAEDGEKSCGCEGDAVVGWAAGEKARDAAADGGVGVDIICLVAGFDIAGNAAAIRGGGARSSCVSIRANATARTGHKVVGPSVGAGKSFLARGKVCNPRFRILFWQNDECDRYDDGGGNEEEKYYTKKGECPDRHTAASATIRFGVASSWGIGRECLVSAKGRLWHWGRPT